MKVVHINTYGNGSTGRIVDNLKRLCAENGIEATSIYSRWYCGTPETSIKEFNKVGFYIDGLLTRLLDRHGLNSWTNTRHIINDLKKQKPDVVHLHNLHGYYINYKLLFAFLKQENTRVIWTFHDAWPMTGHCTHFDYVKCDKWKSGCEKCPQLCEYPASKFVDRSRKNYRDKKQAFNSISDLTVVTPSEWLGNLVRQSHLKSNKILVINNGIDLSSFRKIDSDIKKRHSLDSRPLILAVAGSWTPRKGLDYIIEIAKEKTDWQFVVVGTDGKSENISGLNNILFIDRTENIEELAKWYSAADVYANPTLEDNYPTTNLEAIACETPVVTFPTGGSVEIVEKTGCGIVCEGRDSTFLEKSIDEALKKSFSHDLFENAKKLIDDKNCNQKYLNLYRNNSI